MQQWPASGSLHWRDKRVGGNVRVPHTRAAIAYIDGLRLERALIAGVGRVIAQREAINRINVFPVADGDTGTNLAFTMSAMLKSTGKRERSVARLLNVAADLAIDGARGNSGAIFAQFIQGLSQALTALGRVGAQQLASAASFANEQARNAVAQPREGTMLSVMSAFAAELETASKQGCADIAELLTRGLSAADRALKRTPEQLAELRAAGVVDAGGQGFVDWLRGIQDYIQRGVVQSVEANLDTGGADFGQVLAESSQRYCCECVVSAERLDRLVVGAALVLLNAESVVLAGTVSKLKVHAHTDSPAALFETLAHFGRVSSQKADDMRAQANSLKHAKRARVAIVTDSAADIPDELLEALSIHVVPARIQFGDTTYLDKVSLTSREFFEKLKTSPKPLTSQPPPGDFRRQFEYLLAHHDEVLSVNLSRALSGTMQAAENARARGEAERITVVDTFSASVGEGLIVCRAAELAREGLSAAQIKVQLAQIAAETPVYAIIRDLDFSVRGGRIHPLIGVLGKRLGLHPMIRSKPNGKIGLMSALFGSHALMSRFAKLIARGMHPDRPYRAFIGHADALPDADALAAALRERAKNLGEVHILPAGSAISVHAGPGAVIVAVQPVGA